MNIYNSCIDLIVQQCRIEYNGTHAPHNETPLYGRRAYWRVYIGDSYVCKITAPVKSLNPKQATLDKLFKAELAKRIQAIGYSLDVDHYGCMRVISVDPYGVRALVDLLEGKYTDILKRQLDRKASNDNAA